jgi:hypothetical protein
MTNFQHLYLIDHAPIHVLMMDPVGGEIPRIVSDEIVPGTGNDERWITFQSGDQQGQAVFTGATLMGAGPAVAKRELERIELLRAELDKYENNIRALLDVMGVQS